MHSKNKRRQSTTESEHAARIADMDCIVCGASSPSEVHEPEQGLWFIAIPLCAACHRGPEGWHGTRLRWNLRKMTELKAINATAELLAEKGPTRQICPPCTQTCDQGRRCPARKTT